MAADAAKYVLPASPNWYCSSISDCSLTGIYAFGARNCVYLVDVNCEPPEFKGQLCGHSERVSAVTFCKHKLDAGLAASGADDRVVKIWNVEKKLLVAEHKKHQAKITCITWSPVMADLIVSGDEKGYIHCWRYLQGDVQQSCPVADHIFCVATSSLSADKAAVGYKNGLILILSLIDMKVLHKLRGHDSEVHSIAWCPTPTSDVEFGPLQQKVTEAADCVLISGSRDQTLRLWDASHGKVLSVWQLPKRSGQKWRDRYSEGQQGKERLWLSLCWPAVSPNHVISTSHGGDLLLCCLGKEGKEQFKTFATGHSRIAFNISCNVNTSKAVSVSMDRQIILWDLQSLKCVSTIPTLGGFVYSLSLCPLDPGTVGLGVGDNMVRVWHTTSPLGPYDAFTLWQGIRSKVMVVQWHPLKEGLLAFGTDDGQVGIYNILTKRVENSASYHKKSVYSISWGPPCPSVEGVDQSIKHLYSCGGEGIVLEHRPGHLLEDAVDVNALIGKSNNMHKMINSTEVAWNPDGSSMAVGNEDGSIEVFLPPALSRACLITVHRKSITCLAWHHQFGTLHTDSGDTFDCKFWLASGSNESVLHVHDLTMALAADSGLSHSALLTESYRQLAGHTGRVTRISWSPHQAELLVSSSYDGTAQVWDVMKGQPLANFRGHVGRVMCVAWSYLDPDVVYSGGDDGTVRPWRPSQMDHTHPPSVERKGSHSGSHSSKSKKRNKQRTAKDKPGQADHENWRQQTTADSSAASPDVSEQKKLSNGTRTDETKPTNAAEDDNVEAVPDVATATEEKGQLDLPLSNDHAAEAKTASPLLQHLKPSHTFEVNETSDLGSFSARSNDVSSSKKKKKVKSMFPLSAVADNKSKVVTQDECITLSKLLYGEKSDTAPSGGSVVEPGTEGHVNLGLFTGRHDAYKMFQTEGEYHRASGNADYQLQLEIWKGNLDGALEVAIKKRQLSDWLVSLSPLGGRDVWLAATEAYAKQLLAQGAYHRAVLYYLACYKVYQAIDVFSNQAMYREAIALAKVRLSPLDPVLRDLYFSWARKLETENAYEQAAKCYLAVDLPADAVQVLSRRGDHASTKTAFQVALISGRQELAVPFALRLAQSSLLDANWREAADIITSCPGVEAHLLHVYVHEIFFDKLVKDGIFDGDLSKKASSSTGSRDSSPLDELTKEFSDVKAPYPNSPWLLDADPGPWFVLRVLQAWSQRNLLKSSLPHVTTLFATLSSYHGSHQWNSTDFHRMLIKISHEISLGLLAFLLGQWDTGTRYWLQTLVTCHNHCLYKLERTLCSSLLPHGVESMENLAVIKHKLLGGGVPLYRCHVDYGELFRPFFAFYCVSLLYDIWWKNPGVLLALDAASKAAESSQVVTGTDSLYDKSLVQTKEDNPLTPDTKELPSLRSPSQQGICYTLYSVILNITLVVLSENDARVKTLNDQLAHVRRELNAIRSKKLLEEATSGSKLTKRKLKGLQKIEQTSNGPSGCSPSSYTAQGSEDNSIKTARVTSLVEGESAELEDATCKDASIAGHGNNDQADTTGVAEGSLPPLYSEGSEVPSFITDGRAPRTEQDESFSEAADSCSEITLRCYEVSGLEENCLLTTSGQLSLEKRYIQENERTVEFLAEEESRLQKELSNFKQKNFPFPDPMESASVICHLCVCPKDLSQIQMKQYHQLGQQVVQWALRHAQTSKEIRRLQKLDQRYEKIARKL